MKKSMPLPETANATQTKTKQYTQPGIRRHEQHENRGYE